MKNFKKILLYTVFAISSIAINNQMYSAVEPEHPLLQKFRASNVNYHSYREEDIELLVEDKIGDIIWMVKGIEGAKETGKGGFGLEHIIYHEAICGKNGKKYTGCLSHFLGVLQACNIISEEEAREIHQTYLNDANNIDQITAFKTQIVPKYKEGFLKYVENMIKNAETQRINAGEIETVIQKGNGSEIVLDRESKQYEDGWVYYNGKVCVLVRSNGFISNIYATDRVPSSYRSTKKIIVITDGISMTEQEQYMEYLQTHQKKEIKAPPLTLTQCIDYYKHVSQINLEEYALDVSCRGYKNVDDRNRAQALGFKSSVDYYRWRGDISPRRIRYPQTIDPKSIDQGSPKKLPLPERITWLMPRGRDCIKYIVYRDKSKQKLQIRREQGPLPLPPPLPRYVMYNTGLGVVAIKDNPASDKEYMIIHYFGLTDMEKYSMYKVLTDQPGLTYERYLDILRSHYLI